MRIVSFAIRPRLFQCAHMFAYTFAALSIIAVTACGGGDDKALTGARVLHFTGRDETEANFRDRVRQVLRFPEAKTGLCLPLVGKSPEAARELLRTSRNDDNEVPTGATARPGQKASESDLLRSAEIVIEECKN